ncbi:unnamed protein product [Cuscuta campestris]|uniref:CASP-like protein n=1 Tax=Cuscuta campestris TaxID=132261 RepID=A0A484LAV2_9ASTE|nr:unnamed protein product [Cuscuta campestris]
MESTKPEPIPHLVPGKPESVSHPVSEIKEVVSRPQLNLEDPGEDAASDSSPASSSQMESKIPQPISPPVPGKPDDPVHVKEEAGSQENLEGTGKATASDSPPACSSRMGSKKRVLIPQPVAGKSESVSRHPSQKKPKSVFDWISKETHKETASDSSLVRFFEMENWKQDPVTGKPETAVSSDSSPASYEENSTTNIHKHTTSGDGITDIQYSPPAESEEKAIISVGEDVAGEEANGKRSGEQDSLALVKIDQYGAGDMDGGGGAGGGRGGENRRRLKESLSELRKSERQKAMKKGALSFRVFGFVLCLASFSLMVANRKQGWAMDSFELYREFRYSVSVNAMGFVYSGAQAIDLIYHSATGKNVFQHPLRSLFDFLVDQVIAYLLISASSSAITRVEEWRSNWGEDKFPDMACASVIVSFIAFVALAFSSLISGYALCTPKPVHT